MRSVQFAGQLASSLDRSFRALPHVPRGSLLEKGHLALWLAEAPGQTPEAYRDVVGVIAELLEVCDLSATNVLLVERVYPFKLRRPWRA